MLLCGCGSGSLQKKQIVEDIFDPMGYAQKGYFEMTKEKILSLHPEATICTPNSEDDKVYLDWARSWTVGEIGEYCSETFRFENDHLKAIYYNYYFYDEFDGEKYFLQLCERMQQITDYPAWFGYKKLYSWDYDQDNYCEKPIQNVEQSILNDECEYYEYRVDMENSYYDDYAIKCGYEPFNQNNIKTDARWISGVENVSVIRICYQKYYPIGKDFNREKSWVTLVIEI